MKFIGKILWIWTLLIMLVIPVTPIGAQYTCVFDSFQHSSSNITGAYAINNSEQIVGYILYNTFPHTRKGFILDESGFTLIEYPGVDETYLFDINDAGQIVGGYPDFLYENGEFTLLDAPASGINNLGQIVGPGYLNDGGVITTIAFPGAQRTVPWGINDVGQIVGNYWDSNNTSHGFLFENNSYTSIDYPGAEYTHAYDINNAGQIVGDYWDGTKSFSFLLDNGSFITIDHPDAGGTYAYSINESGQIVGEYWDESGGYGFLATCRSDSGPDLTVKCKAFHANDFSKKIRVTANITNVGSENADPFVVSMYLSDNGIDLEEPPLDELDVRRGIRVGRSKNKTLRYVSGGSLSGKYVVIIVDSDEVVNEITEDNNKMIIQIP